MDQSRCKKASGRNTSLGEKPAAQYYVYMVLCYLCTKKEWEKQASLIMFTCNYIEKFWKDM